MNFSRFKELVCILSKEESFQVSSEKIKDIVFSLEKEDLIVLVDEIGAIPESIDHDSTEEKLYSKASDIILAKCFMELGLKAEVLQERADSADVVAKSKYHNYSLIADAKAFRVSRAAKNQKDFKVESMVHWRKDNDYSILCCPYFQYPRVKSQIYSSALQGNVLLFSWEYFSLLLQKNIKETENNNLAQLWNFSKIQGQNTTVDNIKRCFLKEQNKMIQNILGVSDKEFEDCFDIFKNRISTRCKKEILYWENLKKDIENYSKEQAITALIKSLKLNEKISVINSYINQLEAYDSCR